MTNAEEVLDYLQSELGDDMPDKGNSKMVLLGIKVLYNEIVEIKKPITDHETRIETLEVMSILQSQSLTRPRMASPLKPPKIIE